MNSARKTAAVVVDLPRQLLMLLVKGYRLLLKPWLGNACRFEPTCSAYALQALQQQGAWRGSALTGWRLLRCHPWCEGGHDPVPAHFSFRRSAPASGLFTALIEQEAQPSVAVCSAGSASADRPPHTDSHVSPRTPS